MGDDGLEEKTARDYDIMYWRPELDGVVALFEFEQICSNSG